MVERHYVFGEYAVSVCYRLRVDGVPRAPSTAYHLVSRFSVPRDQAPAATLWVFVAVRGPRGSTPLDRELVTEWACKVKGRRLIHIPLQALGFVSSVEVLVALSFEEMRKARYPNEVARAATQGGRIAVLRVCACLPTGCGMEREILPLVPMGVWLHAKRAERINVH